MPDDRDAFDDDESPTLPPCLACGGSWRTDVIRDRVEYRTTCRWCTRGGMTPDQIKRWSSRKQRK